MTTKYSSLVWVDFLFGFLLVGSLLLSRLYPEMGIVLFTIGAGAGYMLRSVEKMVVFDRMLSDSVQEEAEEVVQQQAEETVPQEVEETVQEEAEKVIQEETEETVQKEVEREIEEVTQ